MRETEQRIAALMNNEVQIAQFVPPHLVASVEASPGHKIVPTDSIEIMFLAMQPKPPFDKKEVRKALKSGGFQNVRFTNNPLQALRSLEKRPAQILIADWMMPSIDGLELTRRVKKLDDTAQHFTYVMLLTARVLRRNGARFARSEFPS